MPHTYTLTTVFEGRVVLGYILEDAFIFNYTENQFSSKTCFSSFFGSVSLVTPANLTKVALSKCIQKATVALKH